MWVIGSVVQVPRAGEGYIMIGDFIRIEGFRQYEDRVTVFGRFVCLLQFVIIDLSAAVYSSIEATTRYLSLRLRPGKI
jgi:hypothetical protein